MNLESRLKHQNCSNISTTKAMHQSSLFENMKQIRDNTPNKHKNNFKINFRVFDSAVINDVKLPNIKLHKDSNGKLSNKHLSSYLFRSL